MSQNQNGISSGFSSEWFFIGGPRVVRPLRAKHCRICDRCVAQFDHHCPYIYNCVGLRNRGWFLLFTLSVAVNCSITIFFAFYCIRDLPITRQKYSNSASAMFDMFKKERQTLCVHICVQCNDLTNTMYDLAIPSNTAIASRDGSCFT